MDKFKLFSSTISFVADVMTIIGVGGLVSWSIFTKDRGPFQRKVAAVLAFSLKTGFCLITLAVVGAAALYLYIIIIIVGVGHGLNKSTFFWDSNAPTAYIIAYLFVGLLFLPLYLLLCSSIYEWSLEPFRRLRDAFNKVKQKS